MENRIKSVGLIRKNSLSLSCWNMELNGKRKVHMKSIVMSSIYSAYLYISNKFTKLHAENLIGKSVDRRRAA